MKASIIFPIAAIALLLASCTADDFTITEPSQPIVVTVSDNGFANPDATRTYESLYTYATIFTEGDRIGIFAVRNGKVSPLANNLCLEYNGSKWQSTDGSTLQSIPGATYYAYYPYTAGTTIDPTATTTDEMFASLINGWTTADDQSSYQAYTGSDLMISAEGATVSDGKLSLSLSHKMGLLVITVPNIHYQFTGTTLPDYVVTNVHLTDGHTPYLLNKFEGIYRYLVSPKTSQYIHGYYDDSRYFLLSTDVAPGYYKDCQIDGGSSSPIIKQHTLQAGDYVLKFSGLIVPHEAISTTENKVSWFQTETSYINPSEADDPLLSDNVAGIIYYVRDDSSPTDSYYPNSTGYIVSIDENCSVWSKESVIVADDKCYNNEYTFNGGYVKSYLEEHFSNAGLTAFNWTTNLMKIGDNDYVEHSSWYLPAELDYNEMHNNLTAINNSLNNVGGTALTSKNYYTCNTYKGVIILKNVVTTVVAYTPDNLEEYPYRAVCAFTIK